jgi:short subunit dehydrogenase-like uncharacterized protein
MEGRQIEVSIQTSEAEIVAAFVFDSVPQALNFVETCLEHQEEGMDSFIVTRLVHRD